MADRGVGDTVSGPPRPLPTLTGGSLGTSTIPWSVGDRSTPARRGGRGLLLVNQLADLVRIHSAEQRITALWCQPLVGAGPADQRIARPVKALIELGKRRPVGISESLHEFSVGRSLGHAGSRVV